MADMKRTDADDKAGHGGGVGDIGRQPIDPSSQNPGNGVPAGDVVGGTGGTGLVVDEDATPSGEDPDTEADETLGTVI